MDEDDHETVIPPSPMQLIKQSRTRLSSCPQPILARRRRCSAEELMAPRYLGHLSEQSVNAWPTDHVRRTEEQNSKRHTAWLIIYKTSN